jgi:LDH2 family malate/lactate/ureidoglycolate dehydrogenase
VLVRAEEERELIATVLTAHGAPPAAARLQADWLVEGDLRGHPSHGVQRLATLVGRVDAGLIDPAAEPDLRWRTESVLTVDGRRGFGPVVAMAAIERAVAVARRSGVVLVAIRNANHLGILAPYVEAIAAARQVGLAATTSEALVHPYAGTRRMLGTNPLAVAVPADPAPLVLDMATGVVSMGRIIAHARRGLPLEEGWAVDAGGLPTIDAEAALLGAISPFGGAKGYGLGLALEVLVASLTASALGTDVAGTLDTEQACNKGDLFVCIDPALLQGGDTAAVSRYLDDVRGSDPAPGRPAVRVPGDRAAADRAGRLAGGIEIADAVWAEALRLASRGAAGAVSRAGMRGDTAAQ